VINSRYLVRGSAITIHPSSTRVVRFGIFEADLTTGELRKNGLRQKLPAQPFQLLQALLERPGEMVTREELRQRLWPGNTFVDYDLGLKKAVNRLREVLGDSADNPRFIETVPRHGYRFMGGVLPWSVPIASTEPHAAVSGGQPERLAPHAKARFSGKLIATLSLAVAAALLLWFDAGNLRTRIVARARPLEIHSIAVLPLLNLTGDASQDYFADGMTEALTTDLARMETLQVLSRYSTMQYKQPKKPLSEIAKELHADAIVEGSVQRSGNRVRVTAQLIRAATDKHLWAETYERDSHDVLALQDDVASAIARQIQSKLGGPEPLPLAKSQPINSEAYEIYLKANSYLDQFDLQKSIDYYSQAIKLAPDFAPAYAHMARAYFFLGFFSAIPPHQAWGKVKEAALLATSKDDRLPEGHETLALAKLHYDWDFTGAEQEFKRAVQLNPNSADTLHDFAHYLMAMGRMDESAATSRRAVDLDPVDDGLTDCLCWHRFAARQYDSSIQLALEVLKRQPSDTWEQVILGWDYEQKGMTDQAVAEFKSATESAGKDSPMYTFVLAGLGHAYATAGKKNDAQGVLQALLARATQSYASPFDIALVYTALGDKDAAFSWLDKAVADRSTWLVYSKWEPRLDPLRSDPRFKDVLRRIGLPS